MMCVMCVPCSRFKTCEVCDLWSEADWDVVEDHRYQQLAKLPGDREPHSVGAQLPWALVLWDMRSRNDKGPTQVGEADPPAGVNLGAQASRQADPPSEEGGRGHSGRGSRYWGTGHPYSACLEASPRRCSRVWCPGLWRSPRELSQNKSLRG